MRQLHPCCASSGTLRRYLCPSATWMLLLQSNVSTTMRAKRAVRAQLLSFRPSGSCLGFGLLSPGIDDNLDPAIVGAAFCGFV